MTSPSRFFYDQEPVQQSAAPLLVAVDEQEMFEKGRARGSVIERDKINPAAFFEFAPPVVNPVALPPEPLPVFAAESAAENAKVSTAQAELDEAESAYREALANAGGYSSDRHLIDLVSSRTVRQDLLALAIGAQTEGRNRRAKLVADGVPQAFEAAKQASTVAQFRKRSAAAVKAAEKAGRLLAEARALVTDAVHAHAPLQQEAQRLANQLGIKGFRPDGGTDMSDAVRLVSEAAAEGFKAGGANTIELTRWLGS